MNYSYTQQGQLRVGQFGGGGGGGGGGSQAPTSFIINVITNVIIYLVQFGIQSL